MLMKNGAALPKFFEQALENDSYALTVFMKMNAAYQDRCVKIATNSDESSPSKRIQSAIAEIHKYGKLRGF